MKKISISNTIIIIFMALFVAGIMLASFAIKSKNYIESNNYIQLTVQKKEFDIYAQTNGVLASSSVTIGQHVKKGDTIGQINNATLDQQISVLKSLSDNASASVQLSQLEAQKAAQTLYAPTDGVVADAAVQGEDINTSQKVATIYSDDSVQLVGNFSYASYSEFQQNTSHLTAVSKKDNQQYTIDYAGTLQQVSADKNDNSYVSLFFTFESPSDAANVLQGEQMTMKLINNDGNTKPIDNIVDLLTNSIFNITN